MNKTKLKSYAPQARKDFITAVTARAYLLGLSEKGGQLEVTPSQTHGDVTLIAGQAWPAKVSSQRQQLIARIRRVGFARIMEAAAYTWFNRFAALRYMELHDYLGHGHRALSSREGGLPEILAHAADLAQSSKLPGLQPALVTELKLAGNRDGELYRLLLIAQCNALSSAMPFLFERIDDETELLLPDNLLRTDSVIAKLVEGIPEDDWQQVEIIGWLYQFYISEKKDQVIGKVVKSEDIPAATQLFTPNWIVQYLVQNSVGRLWLLANPASTLKSQWPYYIEPAEQTPEVRAQLAALIQTRMAEDGGSLNPETITVLDPACGSGHILVEAYDLLKAIYLERGYQPRAIPRLILEKNLYGLDIDDRAAQLAGFALLMKACADDRRLLDNAPKLNVLSLQENKGLDLDELANHLEPFGVKRAPLANLLDTFAHGKTFGSLIEISQELTAELAKLAESLQEATQNGDLYAKAAAQDVLPLMGQAIVLGMKFDAVVANPPYMGVGYFNDMLASFASSVYRGWAGDLYTCFIKKSLGSLKQSGTASLITIGTWSFLPTYAEMRHDILFNNTVLSLVDNGRGIWGSDHGTIMVSIQNYGVTGYRTAVKNLSAGKGKVQHIDAIMDRFTASPSSCIDQNTYKSASGCVISVGVSDRFMHLLATERSLSDLASVRQGIKTGDIEIFVRYWFEVEQSNIYLNCESHSDSKTSVKKWYPCNKGGEFRKWYGNLDHVLNWQFDGEEIRNFKDEKGRLRSRPQNVQFFFKEGLTWSTVTMGKPSFRYSARGRVFESGGSTVFLTDCSDIYFVLGVINSRLGEQAVTVLSPKVSLGEGAVSKFPVPNIVGRIKGEITENARALVRIFQDHESESEQSLDFSRLPVWEAHGGSLADYFETCKNLFALRLKEVEAREASIDALVSSELGESWNSIQRGNWQDYGVPSFDKGSLTRRLLSFSVGCMMGRYSLDEPGPIYAQSGSVGFDAACYKIFPADANGIVALTDDLWFENDAANRIPEVLLAIWGSETLDENMAWLAESLGAKGNETSEETIRRYLADKFFKDHLQTYKRRPIYWLFSSGKQGAFQALVYLHRYHEGTLARLRAEFVLPLTGKIQFRIEMLQKDAAAATSTANRNKLAKEVERLKRKHVELLAYDEQLRHYADMRISLALDDGVKVNYAKFGDLLAEAKVVTGGTAED